MALTTGTRLGHYEIVTSLGAGEMGDVYRARDEDTSMTTHHTAVLYARVSSKDQEREGFSIPAQQNSCGSTAVITG